MNQYKIDFITACNDERCFAECKFYIEQLEIPTGYEIDILGIVDGQSMAAAYNEGMTFSDAKYKVYLHQDVFILNRRFLYDILTIFQADSTIGMIGVLGGVNLPSSGIFYNAWNVGKTKADNAAQAIMLDMNPSIPYMSVEAIDGMIMITAYDIPWREDIFTGWDFYDASQSFEFRQKGYQVVVPRQQEAWCMHDCGISKLQNYDKGREIFCREYIDGFKESSIAEQVVSNIETNVLMQQIREKLIFLIGQGNRKDVSEVLRQMEMNDLMDTQLRIMKNIFEIYESEQQDEGADYIPFVSDKTQWSQLYTRYREIKYFLCRIEQGYTDNEGVKDLLQAIDNKQISKWALKLIVERTVWDMQKFHTYIQGHIN